MRGRNFFCLGIFCMHVEPYLVDSRSAEDAHWRIRHSRVCGAENSYGKAFTAAVAISRSVKRSAPPHRRQSLLPCTPDSAPDLAVLTAAFIQAETNKHKAHLELADAGCGTIEQHNVDATGHGCSRLAVEQSPVRQVGGHEG